MKSMKRAWKKRCDDIKSRGVDHMVFGDLFLEDIRAYRVEKLTAAKMTPLFPLWLRDTAKLARDMIASGLVATSSVSIRASSIAASPGGASTKASCAICRRRSTLAAKTASFTRW